MKYTILIWAIVSFFINFLAVFICSCVLYMRLLPNQFGIKMISTFLLGLLYAFASFYFMVKVRKDAVIAKNSNSNPRSHEFWMTTSFLINFTVVFISSVFILKTYFSLTGLAYNVGSLLIALCYALVSIKFITLAKKQAVDEHCCQER